MHQKWIKIYHFLGILETVCATYTSKCRYREKVNSAIQQGRFEQNFTILNEDLAEKYLCLEGIP